MVTVSNKKISCSYPQDDNHEKEGKTCKYCKRYFCNFHVKPKLPRSVGAMMRSHRNIDILHMEEYHKHGGHPCVQFLNHWEAQNKKDEAKYEHALDVLSKSPIVENKPKSEYIRSEGATTHSNSLTKSEYHISKKLTNPMIALFIIIIIGAIVIFIPTNPIKTAIGQSLSFLSTAQIGNNQSSSSVLSPTGCPNDFLSSLKTYFDPSLQSQDLGGTYYNSFCLNYGDSIDNYSIDSITICFVGASCTLGSSTGQNVNYLYCSPYFSNGAVDIHKNTVNSNGIVIERKDYSLIIDSIAIAPAIEKPRSPNWGETDYYSKLTDQQKRHIVDISCRKA